MKLNQKDIDLIRSSFHKMQSNSDLLGLINRVNLIISDNKIPFATFKLSQLTYHAFHNKKLRYNSFKLKKKNGSERQILAPLKTLKRIQKCLNVILECVFNPHNAAHGFIPNKSIVTNARLHIGQNYVYNVDLKDFFHSVDQARVWACLQNTPFNLKEDKLEIANLITALCCESIEVERRNEKQEWIKTIKSVLPQGAPTSPILTNIVAQRLDFQLTGLAKRFNLKYSRYADDLTFSSMHNVYKKDSEFVVELILIIKNQNFYINESKVRLQERHHQRQEVTGLIVNEKVNIKRKYVKDIRRWLHLWKHYGYARTNEIFVIHYKSTRSDSKENPNFINVLGGKLEYLKMVVGYDNNRYKLLSQRYDELYEKTFPPTLPIEKQDNKIELISSLVPISSVQKTKKREIDLTMHRPKDVTRFLSLFRSGELKWLTHDKDTGEPLELEDLINNAYREFKSETTNKFIIPQKLYARIDSFIGVNKSKNKYWSFKDKRNEFHWQSDEVRKWCEKNPYQHPIAVFEDVINTFRESIQVRENLHTIIMDIAAKKFGREFTNYNIIAAEDVKAAEFFTDVEKLRLGIGCIFNLIKQRKSEFRNIKIEFKRIQTMTEDYRLIRIIHLNSESLKPLNEIDFTTTGGDMPAIMEHFYQIADWSIIAKHPDVDKYNKVNILYDIHNKKKEETILGNIEGFTHELIFYS